MRLRCDGARLYWAFSLHLLAAAFLAISARRSGVIFLALAAPPFLPSAFAAGSLPSSGIVSSISPVSTRMTWTALPITSAGRFSPLGPLGTLVLQALSLLRQRLLKRRILQATAQATARTMNTTQKISRNGLSVSTSTGPAFAHSSVETRNSIRFHITSPHALRQA